MLRVFITVAMGLALNLPSTVLGQLPELPVHPGDLIELRIGGAVHNGGLFDVDPTVTVSGALAMAGGPTTQGRGDEVWVFRDGKIITTLVEGTALIADSPVRSGDRLFVAWASAVPERSWISRNAGPVGMFVAATAGIVFAFAGN